MGPKPSTHPRRRYPPSAHSLENLLRQICPSGRYSARVCKCLVGAYACFELDGWNYAEVGCGSGIVWGWVGNVWDVSWAGCGAAWCGVGRGNEERYLEEGWCLDGGIRSWRRVWGNGLTYATLYFTRMMIACMDEYIALEDRFIDWLL